MKNISLLILAGAIIILSGVIYGKEFAPSQITVNQPPQEQPQLGAVTNYLETSASAITHTTSTVNTTSTQVFSSITKIAQIINDSAGKITCSMDATGTTAPSSTVAAGRGIVIPPLASSTKGAVVTFGECYPGSEDCYTHKGAVNCLSTSAATITKWSK